MSGNSRNDQRSSPKYAARVPESIRTPDVVESSRLGRLEFFDGMPSDETVRKWIAMELFMPDRRDELQAEFAEGRAIETRRHSEDEVTSGTSSH
ncbi:MAG: hypothetical protein WCA08_18120 [Desulfoferrobacter sp.]